MVRSLALQQESSHPISGQLKHLSKLIFQKYTIKIAPSKNTSKLPPQKDVKIAPSKHILSSYLVLIYSSSESSEEISRSPVIYLTPFFLFQCIYIL